MGEESLSIILHDRAVEQAILSMKKGAYLLKSRHRGKPKFYPFRLSMDEKFLVWYSGNQEKQLRLSSVMKIIPGKMLTCKDKAQADCWYLGLKSIISRNHHPRPLTSLKDHRGPVSCANSPAGFIRRKYNLGLLEDTTDLPQVRSLCGSPTLSLSERCLSDGLSHSFDSFYPSDGQSEGDISARCTPLVEPDALNRGSLDETIHEKNVLSRFVAPVHTSPRIERNNILKDVMIWGEGIEGGLIGGGTERSASYKGMLVDALLPKLLESTMMLDVESISLGGKHAALVTKHGEIFSWGEGKYGRLGHKINMDFDHPKLVDLLNGITAKSVACGEYQTCALTNAGEVYTWGDSRFGADFECEQKSRSQWLPQKLSGPLNGISISNVACGDWHIAVVSACGRLFTYGDGTFGALGHGNLLSLSQPKEVESLNGLFVKSVACGSWHTAAIVDIMIDRFKFKSAVGKLFTWGDGKRGRLGHVDNERKLLPTCVAPLVDCDFVQVSCGRMLTVGLTNLGRVYTMGSLEPGQLGNLGSKDVSVAIVEAEGKLKEEFVKAISSGCYHVAALTSTGRVYTWGNGAHGQLGLGDSKDRNLPTFVEALGDKQVESIACGSNFTAAICLHRSITSSDQSSCYGCKLPFGFTRKKHNCYHCGLYFCRMCSSKRTTNAALAPVKTKAFRVCNPCFNNLQRRIHLDRSLKQENTRTQNSLMQQKASAFERVDKRSMSSKHSQLLSPTKQNIDEMQSHWKFINQGENQQHLEQLSFSSSGIPRWGQVLCPASFKMCNRENTKSLISPSQNQTPVNALVDLKSPNSSAISLDRFLYGSSEKLSEEVQRLRTEVKNLKLQCHDGDEKMQKCQQKIEEAWSVAREEAAKCKAAKEIIKALALRLHTMSEKVSGRKDAKDEVDANKTHVTPVYSDSPNFDHFQPPSAATSLPPEVQLPKDRLIGDSLYNSPIVFSNTFKSSYGRHAFRHVSKSTDPDEIANRTSAKNGSTNYLKDEWMEQYEAGVYITFTSLPGGHKGLKRVRFSRRRFSEREAERWWEENQVIVYQKYGIEGYTNSNHSQMED
ncbi:PH, RCC1 and FYVE domains-containing protein 1 isoform X2 [Benincasa hispida]|uniref:PH, RCC1 and FYVE domains-containing protein 1 isoform X2 n=1 Tax=Benincasa hispida TaxID=102211 RepID=UPI0019018F79|nr:PH, RCC1 and FYVE domains-containing protein 1 isoform X2 [Benincasa hispida]